MCFDSAFCNVFLVLMKERSDRAFIHVVRNGLSEVLYVLANQNPSLALLLLSWFSLHNLIYFQQLFLHCDVIKLYTVMRADMLGSDV